MGTSGSVEVERSRIGIGLEETRRLAYVEDEEFDIPPLFDDTEYESLQIPDLDVDTDGEEIYVRKVYANKQDFQIALAIYAIKEKFHFKQTTTKLHSFTLSCTDKMCDWRVLAAEKKSNCNFEISKVYLFQTCTLDTRNGYKEKVTSRLIASVYKSKYGEPTTGPRPMDMQQPVLEDLGVTASYMQCWRAKVKAIVDVRCAEEDSYLALQLLKLANRGTITELETEKDEDEMDRFLYLFGIWSFHSRL